MSEQLIFDFPKTILYSSDTFAVFESNKAAYTILCQQHWPSYGYILVGPHGSGKTHLSHIWQALSTAQFVVYQQQKDLQKLWQAPSSLIIDDLENYLDHPSDLFYMLNTVKEQQQNILITTTHLDIIKQINLLDLKSRLLALPYVEIQLPEDGLLMAIMIKRFADLQISIDQRLLNYILTRCKRSFDALHRIIHQIHNYSISHQQKPSLITLKQILEKI